MGVTMNVKIEGLTCQLTHEPSGAVIRTVPPKDNGGDGSSFSPTDLIGASLAACALSTMALISAKEHLGFVGGIARVVKEMVGPPRKIGSLAMVITLPVATPVANRARLEEIARGCPVARTLSAETHAPISFEYA